MTSVSAYDERFGEVRGSRVALLHHPPEPPQVHEAPGFGILLKRDIEVEGVKLCTFMVGYCT